MKKFKTVLISTIIAFLTTPAMIQAKGTPTFDSGAAKNAANGFLTPLIETGLWAVPIVATAAIAVSGIIWMTKDEDEKEQKPFTKTAKKIVIVALIIEAIEAILKIVGVA